MAGGGDGWGKAWGKLYTGKVDFLRWETVEAVCGELVRGREPPAVVCVGQKFPGEVSKEDVERLRALAPTTPVVSVADRWCEGELRSGQPIAAEVRWYAHHVAPRLDAQLKRLAAGRLPLWGLSAAAQEEDRFLERASYPIAAQEKAEWVAICSAEGDTRDFLDSLCRRLGWHAVQFRPTDRITAPQTTLILWDEPYPTPHAFERLRSLSASCPRARVVVLMNFPREEDIAHALQQGAGCVLSKPLEIEDLVWACRVKGK